MRIAYFSPLPPAKSGIADYSATLLDHLRPLAEVETFTESPAAFDPRAFDVCLYQLGNNPFHAFAYRAAMARPGVIVLHEANLHHLIADLTIRQGDWDAYLDEVAADAGAEARRYAETYVRTLRRGPDYDLPLLRSILDGSKAVIVHSEAVAKVVRSRGFEGPVAKIHHGAWTESVDGAPFRKRLGVEAGVPLIGILGFLKPYKRIAESLRAFRRVVERHPDARMILVGELHPEVPLRSMLSSLRLTGHVRHIDFVPAGDFAGYIAACDIVLNLRYPTVGETSGTLQRSLGMGKAVIVSDVGSFREYPDDICLKTPVDASEEEHLVEYLDLLLSRPEVARELGDRARRWVEAECSWPLVARRYLEFLEQVAGGEAGPGPFVSDAPPSEIREAGTPAAVVAAAAAIVTPESAPEPETSLAGYILTWTRDEDGSRAYAETHLTRLAKTLAITPPGAPEDRVLEMGAYMQITPALRTRLGYGYVRGCYFGPRGSTDRHEVTSRTGERFCCEVDLFDAEKDRFPYDDGFFSTVLCCELLEHLPTDPMHMMGEIHRILKPGGHLVLTTPNIASLRALAGVLQGFHPMLYAAYIRPNQDGEVDPRHAREYTPSEVRDLLENSGFEVTLLDTGPFREEPNPEHVWVESLLDRYMLTQEHRGDGIYAVGRKTGPVRERYPGWLYS